MSRSDFQLQRGTLSGRPRETTFQENVERVKVLVNMYPSFSCQRLADKLSLPKSLVHEVLTRDLNLRNVFAVWVPQNLSEKHKQLSQGKVL